MGWREVFENHYHSGHKLMHFLSSKESETARGKSHFYDRIKFIGSRVSMQISYQVHSEDMNSLVWCWDSLFKGCLLTKSKKFVAVAKAKPRRVLQESSNPPPPCRYLECYFNHRASEAKAALPLNTEYMMFSLSLSLCRESNLQEGLSHIQLQKSQKVSQHKIAWPK